MSTRFVLLGDVHVRTNSIAPPDFLRVTAAVPGLAPDFVLFVGDATSGNEDDGRTASTVRGWWRAFREALAPIREAGIPVLPIAGNHDYYTRAQRAGYAEAWAELRAESAPIALSGSPPLSYSFDVPGAGGGLHVSMIHVVDQAIGPRTLAWLRADLAAARGAAVRLAVGHVPLQSAMGRTSVSFRGRLGGALLDGGVSIYFAGHEHLVWDAPVKIGGRALRQVIVGTPGASYTMGLRPALRDRWCRGATCTMPSTGATFARLPGTGKQRSKVALVQVDVEGGSARVRPLRLDDDGRLAEFG